MKPFKLFAILCVLSLAPVALAQQTGTGDGFKDGMKGTDHDMTTPKGHPVPAPNFVGATALCEFCHAPHKYRGAGGTTPLLWNIQLTTNSFQLYSSSSFEGGATIRQPTAASPTNGAAYYTLLCLSCHDGTVTDSGLHERVSTIGRAGTPEGTGVLSGRSLTGAEGLSNDHPVDFTYSAALATEDGGLQIPQEGSSVKVIRVGAAGLPLWKDQPGDTSGRLECATCHNPHNDSNTNYLRMSNANSALCLNCHGSGATSGG